MNPAFHVRVFGVVLFGCGLAATVQAEPASEEALQAGRALFARSWVPNDPRSRGGDGLGPVFNAQSCLACHDRGGPGGAGTAERNIDIVTATGLGFGSGTQGYAFAYSFGMDLARRPVRVPAREQPPRHGQGGARREPPLDPIALAAIHPGLRGSRSVVLHLFGTDPALPRLACRRCRASTGPSSSAPRSGTRRPCSAWA